MYLGQVTSGGAPPAQYRYALLRSGGGRSYARNGISDGSGWCGTSTTRSYDPVRRHHLDDPHGGPFDGLPTGCGFTRPSAPGVGASLAGETPCLTSPSSDPGPTDWPPRREWPGPGSTVEVYEAAATIGGGTRTFELMQPGHFHDICSAVHPMALASPFFRALRIGPPDRPGGPGISLRLTAGRRPGGPGLSLARPDRRGAGPRRRGLPQADGPARQPH